MYVFSPPHNNSTCYQTEREKYWTKPSKFKLNQTKPNDSIRISPEQTEPVITKPNQKQPKPLNRKQT